MQEIEDEIHVRSPLNMGIASTLNNMAQYMADEEESKTIPIKVKSPLSSSKIGAF